MLQQNLNAFKLDFPIGRMYAPRRPVLLTYRDAKEKSVKLLTKIALATILLSSGCYHVTTHTGHAPNGQIIHKKAHMFVFGLVGHESIAPCLPATIETQQGGVDWLLGALTFGLYTPYSLTVSCAGPTNVAQPMLQPQNTSSPSIRW